MCVLQAFEHSNAYIQIKLYLTTKLVIQNNVFHIVAFIQVIDYKIGCNQNTMKLAFEHKNHSVYMTR